MEDSVKIEKIRKGYHVRLNWLFENLKMYGMVLKEFLNGLTRYSV
jgi:hypothetical protein